MTEAVALYLQKFILYRKRKVFYGADGTNKSMFDVINKHKENEKFLYPCSENQQDNEIVNWLKTNHCEFATPFMYRTISNDVKPAFNGPEFDIICFFTPSGVRSLFDNFPRFKQNGTVIGAFGNNTSKAVEEAGLKLEIKAPQPKAPSMVAALEQYLLDLEEYEKWLAKRSEAQVRAEAISSRTEPTATRIEAIPVGIEEIASRMEAIAVGTDA